MASPRTGFIVVVFPFPFQGDFNPVMRLASALHARGLAITVFHTDYPTDFLFVPVPVEVAPPELMASKDIPAFITALNASCKAPFRDRLSALVASEERGCVRCVLTDVGWDAVLSAASDLSVPALAMMTGGAACFRDYMPYLPVKEERKDDKMDVLPQCMEEFADLLGRTVAAAGRSTGLIFHTFPFIDNEAVALAQIQKYMSVLVIAVAPLHKLVPAATTSPHGEVEVQADRVCVQWLDTQEPRSVLYGSLAAMDPHDFVELAWGLADSGLPFLWVVRPNLIRGFESGALPDGVEEKVRGRGVVVRWTPQEEVLAHPAVGGFFTDNGWNSTVEAISDGVPMICYPGRHWDQYSNAMYVCHKWQMGTELAWDRLERGDIRVTIQRLMESKEGEEIRERMNGLKIAAHEGIYESGSSHTGLTDLVDLIKSF